jgi:hypothetical protein
MVRDIYIYIYMNEMIEVIEMIETIESQSKHALMDTLYLTIP